MPPHSLAVAGGSIGSGLLGFTLRWLLAQPSPEGPPFWREVQPPVECDCPVCPSLPRVAQAASEFLGLLPDNQSQAFFLGVVVGLTLFPLIDILFVLKAAWSTWIARLLPSRRESNRSHIYALA